MSTSGGLPPPPGPNKNGKGWNQYNLHCSLVSVAYARSFGGEAGAKTMCEEWCRKAKFFFDLYERQADPHHVFSDAEVNAYIPSDAFVELLA